MATLNFEINLEEGLTVGDVTSSVVLNENKIDSSTVNVYKIEEADFNCNELGNLNALSSDYVIKGNETYGVYVKDFSYDGDESVFVSSERVAVNGKYVEDYECFSFGTLSTKENVNDMRIILTPTKAQNTTTVGADNTHTTEPTLIEPREQNNSSINVLTYSLLGIIMVLLVIVIILVTKLTKKN